MQINYDKASDRVKKFLLVMVFTHQKWIESKQTKIFWQQNIGWNDVPKNHADLSYYEITVCININRIVT